MNFRALADNLYIDEDDYLGLLVLFLEKGTADLEKCRAAIAAGDAASAATTIHSFKGASGQLGLTQLHEGAIAAEKDVKRSQLEPGAEKIAVMLKEMEILGALVRAERSLPSDR